MIKVLFVCSANKDRSKTAEDHFSEYFPEMEFKSAGTNKKICEQEGTQYLTEDLIDWADRIYVMEHKHWQYLKKNHQGSFARKIKVLHIPDIYKYGQKDLIELLNQKIVF